MVLPSNNSIGVPNINVLAGVLPVISSIRLFSAEDLSNLLEDPVNFKEWVEQREYLLDNLKTTRQKLLAQKANKNQLTQINTSIYNLEKDWNSEFRSDLSQLKFDYGLICSYGYMDSWDELVNCCMIIDGGLVNGIVG